jgi:hypothetical protein
MEVKLVASEEDFERAMSVRIQVFVVEQHVSLEAEQDEKDPISTHWILLNKDKPIGTIRNSI